MTKKSLPFLNAIAAMLNKGDLAGVAGHFAYPMPCYTDDDVQVFRAANAFVDVLAAHRDAVLTAGVKQMQPRIVAEGLIVRGYSNVWAEWGHLDGAGQCVLTNQVHYVFRHQHGARFPKIELMEFTASAFPDIAARLSYTAIG